MTREHARRDGGGAEASRRGMNEASHVTSGDPAMVEHLEYVLRHSTEIVRAPA